MAKSSIVLAVLASTVALSAAQDPADGWMAYARGEIPSTYKRVTRLEMTWVVSSNPSRFSSAFYSPWFGMDPSDNLNLIQPVNPWSGGQWSAYTEYFQWQPEDNSNSKQISVKAGDSLHGSLVYDASTDSYMLSQTNMASGEVSSQTVKCQAGKMYTIPYVVYEKVFPCRDYPPDEKVVFTNITAECDGTPCTNDIKWTANVKDANCDMTANILSPTEISITWNTKMASKYDNYTKAQLWEKNYNGWATKFVKPLEADVVEVTEE